MIVSVVCSVGVVEAVNLIVVTDTGGVTTGSESIGKFVFELEREELY